MTELIKLFGPPILSFVGGVFISYKMIRDKEKQRAKECMEMGIEVLYFSKLEGSNIKIAIGFVGGLFLWVLLMIFVKKPVGIFLIFGFTIIWIFARMYPLFAITKDSFILWNYYGFASPKRYELGKLLRKEFDFQSEYDTIHFVELYQKNYRGSKRIKSFISNAYKDNKKFLELIRQIPEKEE